MWTATCRRAHKVFGWLYEIIWPERRVKQWNRKVYYALKYTLTLAVLGLIIAFNFRVIVATRLR